MEKSHYDRVTAAQSVYVRGFDSMAGEDLTIVVSGEKYGLIWQEDDEGTELLPCIYDNIYFLKLGYLYAVAVVTAGKTGLFVPLGCEDCSSRTIEMRKLLPCVYDRFEPAVLNGQLLFCFSGDQQQVYDAVEEQLSLPFDQVRELSSRFLLFRGTDHQALCCGRGFREVYRTSDEVLCTYAGRWAGGDVFRLTEGRHREQLLFTDFYGGQVRLSPIAGDIRLWGSHEEGQFILNRVCMEWDAGDGGLEDEDIAAMVASEEWRR